MEKTIQLTHPAGKKAVSMDENKYESLRTIILHQLSKHKELSHSGILQAIIQDFKNHGIKFSGSIEWHMEWVKLDLEAQKIIQRTSQKSGTKFRLV